MDPRRCIPEDPKDSELSGNNLFDETDEVLDDSILNLVPCDASIFTERDVLSLQSHDKHDNRLIESELEEAVCLRDDLLDLLTNLPLACTSAIELHALELCSYEPVEAKASIPWTEYEIEVSRFTRAKPL